MNPEEENCTICLNPLSSNGGPHKLSCGHFLHKKCAKALYWENKYRYDEETMEHFRPECPLCRCRIHQTDLPNYRPKTKENLRRYELKQINSPAHASAPIMRRKMRLSRAQQLLQKLERQKAMERLMAQRATLQERISKQLQEEPVSLEESPVRLAISPPMSQASNRSAQYGIAYDPSDLDEGFLPRVATPRYSYSEILSPVHPAIHRLSTERDRSRSRSRSPVSCSSPGQLQIVTPSPKSSQENAASGSQRVSNLTCSQGDLGSQLQELNMHINIIKGQIQTMDTPRHRASSPTFSETSDIELIEIDDDDDDEPEEVEGHVGKGRHARYIVRWNSGQKTLNPTVEVEALARDLLLKYRAHLNRCYVNKHREKKRAEKKRQEEAKKNQM